MIRSLASPIPSGLFAMASLLCLPLRAEEVSAPQPNLEVLSRKLDEADQRSRIVERKLELLEEENAKAKATAPVVGVGDKGLVFKSADGALSVKIGGVVQADGRAYFKNDALANSGDTLLLRVVRPTFDATFFNVADLRITPDFASGATLIQDAYGDLRPFRWLKLRVGKFTPPTGLERLQGTGAIVFAERGTPVALVPNRDVGVQLHGDVAFASYAIGLFNGVVDGASADVDTGFAKDVVGRIFLRPWKSDPYSSLTGLGFGVGASSGDHQGKAAVLSGTTVTTASVTNLPTFKSAGQQTVFKYSSKDSAVDGTVLASGRQVRVAPQASYYLGGFGLLAEYVVSRQPVSKGATSATLSNQAWQVAATYLIGAGKNGFEGVQVHKPFSPEKGGLGVLELAARYTELRLDPDTFPTFADSSASIKTARGFAVAVNWHWSRNIKLGSTYEETRFDGGAKGGDRKTERVLFERLQALF
jgi:phosphate-selective porin OprO/OprP